MNNIISLAKVKQDSIEGRLDSLSSFDHDNYFYTLDFIINDNLKNHHSHRCVICEPMKLMGCHRDIVIQDLLITMVTTFFDDYEDYKEEVKGIVVDSLIRKNKSKKNFSSIQERVDHLILEQLQVDVEDFLSDIEKHLVQFRQSPLTDLRRMEIVNAVMNLLKKTWIRF